MTKKQKVSKQTEKEHRPFRFQSLHERLNSINIDVVHRIRYHERTDLNDIESLTRSSHFHQALDHWSTLNFSEAFSAMHRDLRPLAGSLEQVVFNRDAIVQRLRQSLQEKNPLVLETLLDLIAQLARDLQGDFYTYYKEFLFADIVDLLVSSKEKPQQSEIDTQLLEQVFQCLTYLFKYLWRIMLKDLANLYELYSKFLFSSSMSNTTTTHYEYIRSFAAESFAYLLRKIENYQPLIDYLFDWKERDEKEIESLALVFAETCKNVQSSFHSCTKLLLDCILKKMIVKPETIGSCAKMIYSLLIEHTNQQNVPLLWTCLMDVYRTVDTQSTNFSVYRSFYELFQLLIDHRMITDVDLCWQFLSHVKENRDEDFLRLHYETVAKLFKKILITPKLFEIYYRFVDQTPADLLYNEAKKIFREESKTKLSNEFYHRLWKALIDKQTDLTQLMNYFADATVIERKKSEMVLLPNDNDEKIREKIDALSLKKTFLSRERITEQGVRLIQTFIEETLSKIDETTILVDGQLWRALLLLNSLSTKDLNPSLMITATHLEKLVTFLQNQSISSSTVAMTLLELASHGHALPTNFWYSQLARAPQSEVYLFATRLAFLLHQPESADANQFIDLLKRNLSSFKSSIRLVTLHIFASITGRSNQVILNCLACEESPLNIYEYRARVIHLQKLSVDFLSVNPNTSSFHLAIYYLLGVLCSNFTPLWPISIELLGSYGNKALEQIGHSYFWSIINEQFQWVKEHDTHPSFDEDIADRLINDYFENKDFREYEINEKTVDYIQYRLNLFKVLSHFPQECEHKTKLLFPIIFDFFTDEYYDHILSLGLFGEHHTSYIIESPNKISKRLSQKLSIKTLESILNLLKQFHHWQQWLEPQRLYQFYVRLLLSSSNQIQQLAFQCLLTCVPMPESVLRKEFLPHSEKILPLFQPSTCRKAFHELIQGVLLDNAYSDALKDQFAFILIRVLYSKLNEKRSLGSTTRGRKDYLELNRKYLFQFLITFASNNLYEKHFLYFIHLLLEPFSEELFSDHSAEQWLNIFKRKIAVPRDDFSLSSYEIFIKYLQHSLLLLKTFISKLGVYIQQYLDYFLRFHILTIKFVDRLNEQRPSDDSIQVKKLRTLLKRIRSMAYKGLQTIFSLFDHSENNPFKQELINDLWICCVRESYLDDVFVKKKTREDAVHLLKLAVVWSRTAFLRTTILAERDEAKDLMKYFVGLLNENPSNENRKLIIEFVWNLIQISPDDPLLIPHHDELLNYLTRVSSSMIDSASTMSLTREEFDILLVLSRKESKSDVTEKLCSIFVRLLRQSILSKKKKKFSKKINQQDLNCLILQVLQNLVSKIFNPLEKYLGLLPILCAKITQREQRIELMKLFQVFIDQSSQTSSKTIWCLKHLIELNSWSPNQVDEADYERRLASYKEITSDQSIYEDQPEYLCLFYHCIYELQYSINDLSLREYASQCLHRFLQQLPSYQSNLLTEIRSILKQSRIDINVRHEFIRHLATIIDLNGNHEDLQDLKRLRNYTDVEVDFFNNISHVQKHRRLRALKRLKLIHEEQPFRLTSIDHYLLPIVCSFINDVINNHTQDLQEDIVFQSLTILCQILPWPKYNQLFISYFRQLNKTDQVLNLAQKRCLTRTISAIIDGFHFRTEKEDDQDDRIRRTIQERLLPMILELLSQNSFSIDSLTVSGVGTKNATIDDQRQQAVLLTITCSLIATKLIVNFSHDFIEKHISTILLHIIALLRSRLYSVRDQARDCLCKCVTILGKRYFKFIVQELIAGLKRGYQRFVLLHTIHTLLIHISSLPDDFNIDAAVKVIANLYIEDFFDTEKTESSKASEHENSSYKPSSIPEAKTNKTANVMELLGRLIQSDNELLNCIDPLRQQLISHNDSRMISKCEKCLQRFQTGLISNTHLSMETLFVFIYNLLTKTEEKESDEWNTNATKKGNAIAEERSRYHLIPSEPKRGHARVAQAIKYAAKTNLHCLIAWTLNLLHKLIKKYKNAEEKFLSMVDPFMNHIEKCLHSPYTDVIVAALRNLSSLLEYSLPSLNKQRVTNLYKKVFDLLKIYSSVAGSADMNDLLTLGYRILGTFVQRSMTDGVVLTSEEYQCLFTYIESDLLNVHRQSSAFLLLRSIMRHSVSIISNDKTLRGLLDNLLRSRLQFMIVQSPYDHVRSSCRELFHIYLFSYEHSKAKLKSYFDFFLLQLDYEEIHGRSSVLMFLNSLIQDLPKQRLNDYAAYFFLPLSCHYYNETNQDCKKLFQQNLRALLEKIDDQHRTDLLRNIVLVWLNDKVEHRCLAVQLFLIFIEIEHDRFDQYLTEILPFIQKEMNEIQLEDNEEQQKFNDQYIYHLINVLVYLIKHCPSAISMVSLRPIWLDLLKLVDEKGLLHPHMWVRLLSAQFFGHLFEMQKPMEFVQSIKKYLTSELVNGVSEDEQGPKRKRVKKSPLDQEPLLVHFVIHSDPTNPSLIKVQRLCLCACSQLKPSGLTDEFCLQVTKNLIYLSKILIIDGSHHFDLVVRRCCRLTTFESTKHPQEIARRSSILKWMAALILDLASSLTSHYQALLAVVEREIERDETTGNATLKTLAQEVFDVFKRHGDIHLITSIYTDIAKQRRSKRLERKQKLAVLAINQPEILYRKKRVKQTKRAGLGKKKRLKAIEKAKKNRRKKPMLTTNDDMDDF